MSTLETALWSALFGGVLTLNVLAVGHALNTRSVAALRNLLFVAFTGTSAMLMTGLPQALLPGLPPTLMMVLQAGLVPLASATALHYLGLWLGGSREDIVVHRLTAGGAKVLAAGAAMLVPLALALPQAQFPWLLGATGALGLVAVGLGLAATLRAARRGDPLAHWMAAACGCLAVLVLGLHLKALHFEGPGLGTWALTAVCGLAYFLGSAGLVALRNRDNRKLARLARQPVGDDPATGLPTGSVLLSKVAHAFWLTKRLRGECTVVCLYLRNLYELGDAAGHGVENQILAAMAARIRRAAGFRCVVGLYHPRCFVVVIYPDKDRKPVNMTIARLRAMVAEPLTVVGADQARHDFAPRLGVGVMRADPTTADPMEVLNDAEREALAAVRPPQTVCASEVETVL